MAEKSPVDLFGGKEALCGQIYECLKPLDTDGKLFQSVHERDTPVEILERLSMHQVLDFMFLNNVPLAKVLEPNWDEESKAYWTERMNRSGSSSMIGDDGFQADITIKIRSYVQFGALSKVCPQVPEKTDAEKEHINEMRQSLRQRFPEIFST